jgi:uncharacterized spore protein YtfJ
MSEPEPPREDKADKATEAIASELKQVLQAEANAQAIFGAPLKVDTHTVIPVAMIEMGAGGGGGS